MLELKNINKSFNVGNNEIHILKDINLSVKSGEFIAIVGQSGSGKSTLMNIIGCLDSPSSGEYSIEGKVVGSYNADEKAKLRNQKFGFVFQRYNLINSLNILQNVTLPSVYKGTDKSHREKLAEELLTNLGLKDKIKNLPNILSGGQQQRVSIARALINGGDIILADEPTGALDSQSGKMVMKILMDLHKSGHTIILVTHDINIASYADRVVEIKDGKIISDTVKNEQIYQLKSPVKDQKESMFAFKDRFLESFKMSINSIISHKLRSALTMLGIIIGIASVICVVAIGKGAQEQIVSSIRAIGTNTIMIFSGKGFGDMRANRINSLSVSDSNFLANQSFLEYSTPNTSTSGTVVYKNISLIGILRGGGLHFLDIDGEKIAEGRNFNKEDIENSNSVVIIDSNTKKELFKNENPIGKIVFFNKQPLEIIGVLKENENNNFNPEMLGLYSIYSTVINKITGDRKIGSITVKVKDDVNMRLAEEKITQLLTSLHGKKDFFIRNSDTIKKAVDDAIGTMQIFISSIAIISLVVGGIGVMNIMLVSVTERTKEIGIRMAIGARRLDILQQFLIEAILLCLFGGILGICISFLFSLLFNSVSTDFTMIFTYPPMILALVACSLIGIAFGFFPARNASNLNPIEALIDE